MVNKRTPESDKQKTKKIKVNNEDSQNVTEKVKKNETEIVPKRSTRLRNKSRNNSVDNSDSTNNSNNNNNIDNNKINDLGIKRIILTGRGIDSEKTDKITKEQSVMNSPGAVTRSKSIKKETKVDSDISSSSLTITQSERSRKSSTKTESNSEPSDVKSPKEKSKTKRLKNKKSIKNETYVIEDTNTDNETSTNNNEIMENEITKKPQTVVVEIEDKKDNSSKSPSLLYISDPSETSIQEIESSIISSAQSISSVTDIKDEVNESEDSSQQLISHETISTEEKKLLIVILVISSGIGIRLIQNIRIM